MKNFKILPGAISFILALDGNKNPKYKVKSQLSVFSFSCHLLKYQLLLQSLLAPAGPSQYHTGPGFSPVAEGLISIYPLRFQASILKGIRV